VQFASEYSPDEHRLQLHLNPPVTVYQGGEVIELIDCPTYRLGKFRTIPTSSIKLVGEILRRDRFYLLLGKNKTRLKICVTHGSFFETVLARTFIAETVQYASDQALESFLDVMNNLLQQKDLWKRKWTVEGSSINIRFDLALEAKSEANILNSRKYPQIRDNTLNFILPGHDEIANEQYKQWVHEIVDAGRSEKTEPIVVKHLLNGPFLVFQYPIP
jgi:hypothetical protein